MGRLNRTHRDIRMSRQPLENDLLDLIEGRLAPDRVEAVRAALAGDAALLRSVERMVAHRRGMIELGKATEQAARADRSAGLEVVREAIGRAEREALVCSEGVAGRRRIGPWAAAIGMVAAAGILAAGLTWYLMEQGEAERLADKRKVERSGQARMSAADVPASPKTAAEASPPPEALPTIASLPSWIHTNPDPLAKEAVRAWTKEVEANLAQSGDESGSTRAAGERALGRIKSGGLARLSVEEAAGLAMTRRLRFVVEPSGVDWSRRRAEVMSAAIRGGPQGSVSADAAEVSLSRGDLKIEITAPLDSELAGLRDALGDLQKRFGGPDGESGWFELDSSTEDAAAAPSALPSLRLNDILWWSNGPSAWRPGVSVRVRVEARK